MAWQRLGLVFAPDGAKSWARSHAALPIPFQLDTDIYHFLVRAIPTNAHRSDGSISICHPPHAS